MVSQMAATYRCDVLTVEMTTQYSRLIPHGNNRILSIQMWREI